MNINMSTLKDSSNSPAEQVSSVGLSITIQTPTPPLTSTIHTSILVPFSEGFIFQEPIYCVFTTYAYLGAYQKNSPQQLKNM